MINAATKAFALLDNYVIARWQKRPSTALFWYLPEPPNLHTTDDLNNYQYQRPSPYYLMNYTNKLEYSLTNEDGIIILPYPKPIGPQINPEAAFQYALGLHDHFLITNNNNSLKRFWKYVNFFIKMQSPDGLWPYQFDWFGSKSPWYSALAQARGASVMLRAFLLSGEGRFATSAENAIQHFTVPTTQGGFLHPFKSTGSSYFEEYPETPTGVINGFMAALLGVWELQYWLKCSWLNSLWLAGIDSLIQMLPFYSNGWWSLYDLDSESPIKNVNSPRYHLLEMNYLNVLSIITDSTELRHFHECRKQQYQSHMAKLSAIALKTARKILYR